MLEDIKELWGVLTATHGYNNNMKEAKQLHSNHDKTGKMVKKCTMKYSTLTMVYLANALGIPSKYLMRLVKESSAPPNPNVIMKRPTNLPAIASYAATTIVYSPCNLFLHHCI